MNSQNNFVKSYLDVDQPYRSRSFRHFLANPAAVLGFTLYLVVILVALAAPMIAPYDPLKIVPALILHKPSTEHWFGNDELGRDILSRILYGSRVSVGVSIISISIAVSGGLVFGLISGYYGGKIGGVIMRVMDALSAFPAVLLALGILSAMGPGIQNAMIAIGVVYTPAFTRIIRSSVITVKYCEYVEAARACGANSTSIIFRTILPNCLSPLMVHSSIGFASAITIEAALSYLGLGTQPPTPSWGAMLNNSRQYLSQNMWYSIATGAAISVTVLGLNVLGDGLRDIWDPREH